VPVKHYYFSSS